MCVDVDELLVLTVEELVVTEEMIAPCVQTEFRCEQGSEYRNSEHCFPNAELCSEPTLNPQYRLMKSFNNDTMREARGEQI